MFRKQTYAQLVSRIVRFKLILALALCCLAGGALVLLPASSAMPLTETQNPCAAPGITMVTDGGTNDATDAQAIHDIVSASVAYPYTSDSAPDQVVFTIKVASLSTLTPGTFYFSSFATPDGGYHGVRMMVGPTGTPTFESYVAGASNAGTVDGRFADAVTQALPGSNYNPNGTITIIVKPSDIGITAPGQSLSSFNGATAQTAAEVITGILDWMPTGGDGFIDTTTPGRANSSIAIMSNQSCKNGAPPTPTPTPTPSSTPTPTPTPDNCSAATFSIHMSPAGMADSWGEPSIGVNWKTEKTFNGTPNGGTVMSYGGINVPSAMRVTFDDSTPAAPVATWEAVPLNVADIFRPLGDPILFTDEETGRTFVSQLLGGTKQSTMEFTDNDGLNFQISQGSGINSGVDHQTVGGGPLAAPLTGNPDFPEYKNGVWYCAQDVADANCALSTDGGVTFGPAVPIYTIADCAGLHGHVKVASDGTVYIPNKGCGGTLPYHENSKQAVVLSENNGQTWTIRPVTTSTGNGNGTKSDPSLGIATDGTLYFGYQANDGHARIAVSRDKGQTWINDYDVGAALGIQNSVFPAVVAGDPNRAAFAFFGTTTGGSNYDQDAFPGIWYLFIATTYDGGNTWTTVNATPGDPIQRGGICGDTPCRNLLDFFDATIDKRGRVLVGYDDGCIDGCVQGGPNTRSAKGAIARQVSGKRMFAAYDSCGNPTPTPSPTATPTPTPNATPTPTPTGTPAEGPVSFQGTYDPHVFACTTPRHHFVVAPGKARIVVQVNAGIPTNDLSVSLLFGSDPTPEFLTTADTGTCCEALVYAPTGGVPAGEYQVQVCQTPNTQGVPQQEPFTYSGTFLADSTAGPGATPTPTPGPSVTPTPTPSPSPTPVPTPGVAPPAATFGRNTLTDYSAVAGEPFIKIDKQDNVFVSSPFGVSTTVSLIWKSIDGGRTFIPLGTPIVRDGVIGPGGGDTHQDFDDRNRLYYSDLSAACVTVAVSEDGGNTFPPAQNNFLTCVGSGEDETGATDDRQWIAAFGDGIAYMTVRNLAVSSGGNFHLSKTTDAGRTWHAQIIGNVTQSGPLMVDKQKRSVTVNGATKDAILLYQLYYTGGTLKVIRVTDFNDGSTLVVDNLTVGTPGGSVATVFPVLSVDKAGNVYVVWSDGAKISLATSTDRGNTWSAPKRVSPVSMTGTNVMPWIVAGDPGRIDVVWYRTPGGNDTSSVWDIHMAQSLDALNPNPAFTVNKVNENTIHTGEICLDGLDCDISTLAGEPRDRSFAEFPSIDIDSHGAAYITYNDSHNQLPAPYVMVAKQIGGASLFNSVGMLPEDSGAVTVSQPAPNEIVRTASLTLGGTHSLTPRNFERDESGDAKFPDHGATIGSNIPALDIKSVSLSDNANSLTVTMQVGDLTTTALATAPAQSGGDGVLYLTQFHSGDKVYWVGAEIRAGQARFLTGDLGTINSATSKKYITYDPDLVNSLSVQGQVTNTSPGRITMTIPRSLLGSPANGTKFTSVTGYAFSERGALLPMAAGNANPTSLPVKVDASGAATYLVGAGPQFDGVVEVSIDDPNFNTPQLATLASDAVNDNRWSLTLSGSDLVAGAHTAFVRQRINGRASSATVSVPFTVANTIEQSVTSLVTLITANPRTLLGVTSYDLSMRNSSSQTIMSPLRVELASITSASGTVTAANADNQQTGVGATWDYSSRLGADGVLTANEVSAARSIRFNNPRNEAFTVTFNVIGNLARGTSGASSGSSSADTLSASSSSGSKSSGNSSNSMAGVTGGVNATVGGLAFKLIYNPVLNTVTIQLASP